MLVLTRENLKQKKINEISSKQKGDQRQRKKKTYGSRTARGKTVLQSDSAALTSTPGFCRTIMGRTVCGFNKKKNQIFILISPKEKKSISFRPKLTQVESLGTPMNL
jgi:hypothetical protein